MNLNSDILRKNRIVGYRKKRNLCIRCGKEKGHFGNCEESYIHVDNRIKKIKEIKNEIIEIKEEIEKIALKKTKEITLQRPFIVLDLMPSLSGNIIELSCLNYLSSKYKNFIICIFNDIEKHFSIYESTKIKKMTNIFNIKYLPLQEKINYLHSCRYYFSFYNDLSEYCKNNKISFYIFEENKNANGILKNLPILRCR